MEEPSGDRDKGRSWTVPLAAKTVIATLLLCSIVACSLVLKNQVWHESTEEIEQYLLQRTPIGSLETEVAAYLDETNMQFDDPWRGEIDPENGYPPSNTQGSSFIRSMMGEYRKIFVTSVEAFYIFDSNRKLIEIAVRKSTDSF